MQYDGGKGGAGVAQWIINEMPPHDFYCEPFLGGGAVMRAKRPARSSIGIERDDRGAALWEKISVSGLTVIKGDGIPYLEERAWSSRDLIYADPPYVRSTRLQARALYRCELTDADHVRLLEALKRCNCMVMVSGYWSELYASSLATWRSRTFRTIRRSGKPAIEWLWMNFPESEVLHDYRFLGVDFRERERIARRVKRWARRLDRMPARERNAVVSAIVHRAN